MSHFKIVFHTRSDAGKGRICMLLSTVLSSCVTVLTGGIFYTGFLSGYDINIVDIGIISFIPYLANCAAIFSPVLLERIAKRKWVLAISRLTYFFLHIFATTLMPVIVKGVRARIISFCILMFVAAVINAATNPGYSAWHVNFIPPNVRADYFSYVQLMSAAVSGVTFIISAFLADAAKNALGTIIILRYIAFLLTLIEFFVLLKPREYPYPKTADRVKVKNVFVFPIKNRMFFFSMVVVLIWCFAQNLTVSSLNYYLINIVDVPYKMCAFIDASYALFLLFLAPLWKKVIYKLDWFITFAISAALYSATYFIFSFVTSANYIWLFILVRFMQHTVGVGLNITFANMPFISLPDTDKTYYLSFNMIINNVGAFLGLMAGTYFISYVGNDLVHIFGVNMEANQLLLLVQAGAELVVAALVVILYKKKLLGKSN